MSWDAISAIGEIVGAAAVVVTLLYLSRQIREYSRQMIITSLTDSTGIVADAFVPIYNNQHNLRIWVSGIKAPEALNEEDLEIFMLFFYTGNGCIRDRSRSSRTWSRHLLYPKASQTETKAASGG